MAKLLIIEDQKRLLKNLQKGLQAEGYEVDVADDGDEGFTLAASGGVDLIILDLMLPGRDGLSILRDLRAGGFARPILILTARDTVRDRVLGLDNGANDYLVKPFAFDELVARVRALLRIGSDANPALTAGDLELRVASRRVKRAGVELNLTPREYELLEYLLRNKNKVVSREMIAREVWREATSTMTNLIDVYIKSLRKKVERHDLPPLIHTIRGLGYAIRDLP